MNEKEKNSDKTSKYVFIASINLYESIFENEYIEFDFEKEKCPLQVRKIIVDEVSDFCECVSLRIDNYAPCFLLINKTDNKKVKIQINPKPSEEGKTACIPDSIKEINTKKLSDFKTKEILWPFDENVMVSMLIDGCDHWDRGFLKVSQAYTAKHFSIVGWHEMSRNYALQGILDGDFDTGIQSEGGDSYLGQKILSRFQLTEKDFDISQYQ
tara:strand:+ start:297 stop:932 length:636 start_codon:yes stop_codon:yes gene_type:complete